MDRNQILTILKDHKKDISHRYHLKKIGIFGSYARQEETVASDLDILIEFDGDVDGIFLLKLNLKKELQELFQMPVDLCREHQIKGIFKDQILKDAIYV